jgi:hypothetical protein
MGHLSRNCSISISKLLHTASGDFAALYGHCTQDSAVSAEKRVCAGEIGMILDCVGYKFRRQSEYIAIYIIRVYYYNYIYL